MAYQAYFKRYEIKFLLDSGQKQRLLQAMIPHMARDQYGRVTIRNLYYDTSHYQMIRRSLEKPVYKEKLRIRSYDRATPDSAVFVEIKKKYQKVVYKRRVSLPEEEAMTWLCTGAPRPLDTQISREIAYFIDYYGSLHPTMFLSYEREAYYTREPSDFRVTFDDTILCRQKELSLCAPLGGTPILGADKVLMEIKCSGGIPLWMVRVLSEQHIYKTSFSKYGTAYSTLIFPELKEAINHA